MRCPVRRDDQGAGLAGRVAAIVAGGRGGDLADGVVGVVGDVQVAGGVEGDALGVAHQRGGGRAAVAGVPAGAGGAAGHGVHVAGGHRLAPLGAGQRRRSPGSGCCCSSAMYRSPAASIAMLGAPSRARGGRGAAVAGDPPPGAAGDGVDVVGGHRLAPLDVGRRRRLPGPGCCRRRRCTGPRRESSAEPARRHTVSAEVAGPPSPELPWAPERLPGDGVDVARRSSTGPTGCRSTAAIFLDPAVP